MSDKTATLQPWHDPIVQEVRDAREALLASCDFDLEKLVAVLREKQRAEGRNVVTLSPRRPEKRNRLEAPSA